MIKKYKLTKDFDVITFEQKKYFIPYYMGDVGFEITDETEFILRILKEGAFFEEVVKKVVNRFFIEESVVTGELKGFIKTLEHYNLIEEIERE